ncbi:MAG TPA: nucleotidyl transferase AbiEii/AbiGii toxin family protein [Pyrinomonadaceae bacterium]|nr:nucleotidyl transferase AbiEii/AbiGii toxin family protein [Pyrinomonadaceae bacterium]
MTEKQFYDWQTVGGTDDVMRFVNALEKADIRWCTIGGVAVNHWAAEQMVTLDVDFVVAADSIEKAQQALLAAGLKAESFDWSINFRGASKVSIQLTTEEGYCDFAERGVAADVHGILMRVASLEDTLTGKIRAWSDPTRRQSKRLKDLADIARLIESHPELWEGLPDDLRREIDRP